PDFVALAESYGAYAEAVGRSADFADAFERALAAAATRPALLQLCVDPEAISPTATISELRSRRGRRSACPRCPTASATGPRPAPTRGRESPRRSRRRAHR